MCSHAQGCRALSAHDWLAPLPLHDLVLMPLRVGCVQLPFQVRALLHALAIGSSRCATSKTRRAPHSAGSPPLYSHRASPRNACTRCMAVALPNPKKRVSWWDHPLPLAHQESHYPWHRPIVSSTLSSQCLRMNYHPRNLWIGGGSSSNRPAGQAVRLDGLAHARSSCNLQTVRGLAAHPNDCSGSQCRQASSPIKVRTHA